MKNWVTSDLHFGHTNIMSFCPQSRARFRNDVKYMNEQMVKEWNDLIAPEDTVYILGDVAFLPAQKAAEYMRRCNGSKILIEGNHDRKTLKDPSFRNCFKEIHKYLDVQFNETKVVMFHYPIAEWDQMHRGAVHLHGHLHGGISGMERYRCVDVGMDATGMIAISMDEAIRLGLKGAIKGHHV
jgi:calcineurin-like phosphoesterase family protein